jgi:hypothetical protein
MGFAEAINAAYGIKELSGAYLGGHPAHERADKNARLTMNDDGIHVKAGFRTFIKEPWKNITGLSAEGPDQVQTRFTATRLVLLGPLGLAYKKEKKSAFVVVEGTFGEFIFQVKKKTPRELQAELVPWRKRLSGGEKSAEPTLPSSPHETTASSERTSDRERVEVLKELAELRTQGALTEEEFAAEKARLLAAPTQGTDLHGL